MSFNATLLCCGLLFPLLSRAEYGPGPRAAPGLKSTQAPLISTQCGTSPFDSCFNIQEMGGEEERGIDQSGPVKVSGRGREAGGMKEDKWRDGGKAR